MITDILYARAAAICDPAQVVTQVMRDQFAVDCAPHSWVRFISRYFSLKALRVEIDRECMALTGALPSEVWQ